MTSMSSTVVPRAWMIVQNTDFDISMFCGSQSIGRDLGTKKIEFYGKFESKKISIL